MGSEWAVPWAPPPHPPTKLGYNTFSLVTAYHVAHTTEHLTYLISWNP